jgi:hypothetical protein
MWGRGIEEVEEDEGILESCMGYGELSLESDGRNGEMEKDVCTWHVILMEDG